MAWFAVVIRSDSSREWSGFWDVRRCYRFKRAGQVILDEAVSFGADLIVKGAYTHSRLRQMIFGGATKHLLAASPIPVLMAH